MVELDCNLNSLDFSNTDVQNEKSPNNEGDSFYLNIFDSSLSTYEAESTRFLKLNLCTQTKFISDILRLRTSAGITLKDAAILLTALRSLNSDSKIRNMIKESSRALRQQLYANKVATMVPLEVSSYCASNCTFCGWRSNYPSNFIL